MRPIGPIRSQGPAVSAIQHLHTPRARIQEEDDDEYENDSPFTLILRHRHCLADLAPAGKIPGIRKTGALIGFHRIYSAVLTFEKNTTPIGVFLQS